MSDSSTAIKVEGQRPHSNEATYKDVCTRHDPPSMKPNQSTARGSHNTDDDDASAQSWTVPNVEPPTSSRSQPAKSPLQASNRHNNGSLTSYLQAAQSDDSKASSPLAVRYGVQPRKATNDNATNTDSRSSSRSRSRPASQRDILPGSTASSYSGRCSYCNAGTHSQWNHCVTCSHRLHSNGNSESNESDRRRPRRRHGRQAKPPPADASQRADREDPLSPLTQLHKSDLIGIYASVDYPESIIEETEPHFGATSYSDPVLSRMAGINHNERRQINAYIKRSQRQPTNRRQYLQRTLPNFLPLDRRTVPLPSIKSAGNSPGVQPPLPPIPEHSNTNDYPCTKSTVRQKQKRVSNSPTLSEIQGNRVEPAKWCSSSSRTAEISSPTASTDQYQRHINLIEANIDRIRAMPTTPSSDPNSVSQPTTPSHTKPACSTCDGDRIAAARADQADANGRSVARPPSNALPPPIDMPAGVALRSLEDDSDVDLDLELDEDESSSSQDLWAKPIPDSYWFNDQDDPNYAHTIIATIPQLRDIDLYDGEQSNTAVGSNSHANTIPPLPSIDELSASSQSPSSSQPPDLSRFAFEQPTISRVALPTISRSSPVSNHHSTHTAYVDHSEGASQPRRAEVCPSLSEADQFIEKIRIDGVFGDPVNVTELNSVLYYLLNQVTNNAFAFKKWVAGRETNRSLGESCKFGKTHRKCVQKLNHLSCVYGECGDAYRAWLANPNTATERKLFDQAGNNDRLLTHVRRKHPDALRRARNLLLFYLQSHDMRCTIGTILAPLRKNERAIRRKLSIRPGFDDTEGNIIRSATTSAPNKTRLRRAAKEKILRHWREPVVQIESDGNHYASQCRRGFSPSNPSSCDLKKDGSSPRSKVIIQWNRFRYSALQRYKCRAHTEMRRLSADHADIFIVAPDRLSLGLIRIGSTLLTPSFGTSAIKVYVQNQQSIEGVRSTIIENWLRTYCDETKTSTSEQIIREVMEELCPAINTMRIIVRTLLLIIYVRIKFDLTQLLFERTPLGFGEDQTWNRTAKIIGTNGETQQMGLHTVTDTLGCLMRYGFLNNHSEDHYQKVCLLTDVKALQLLYGNLDTLRCCPTVWGSDNIKSNINLPAKIQCELQKQLDTNPKYQPLKEKLEANDVKVSDLVDVADECQLHKFRRTYKALKDDGLSPKKHGDFELVTQCEIWIVNSIQYGGSTVDEAVPHCGTSTHSSGKWLDVFEFEWEHKEYLAEADNDTAIMHLLYDYLQIDGIGSVSVRNTKLTEFKGSARWLQHKHVLESWASTVHPFYRGQALGRWLNKEKRPNPQWIADFHCFCDSESSIVKVTQSHVSQYIVDIILRLFRINICEYKHAPMLSPEPEYLQWLYQGVIAPLHHKIRESVSNEHTKAIMLYEHTSKQLNLAIQDISVKGASQSRQEDLAGCWKNVNNERFHHTNRSQKRKVAPNQRVEFALIELDVELVEFNVDKLNRISTDRPELFDEEFMRRFEAIKARLADPETLKDVADERYCLNLSDVLEDHIRACNQMITIRDISYKHKKFLTKQNRYNLARDLYVFKNQIQSISIDALGTFAVTYNVSIIPIIKEMQRAGLTADEFEDGVPITAPQSIPRVREMIDKGEFRRITLSLDTSLNLENAPDKEHDIPPMPIQFAAAVRSPNEPYPLPSIEPTANHNFDADSANIGDYNIALLPTFKTLTTLFSNYNAYNPRHRVLLNVVHALNMAQYTLQDFIQAFFDEKRINVVYNNVFTAEQVKGIHEWATTPGYKSMLMAVMTSTSKRISHLSYQQRHGTVTNPKCVAMNVLGNDATKNAKYAAANKKRRITEIADDDETEPPKKKHRESARNCNQKKVWRAIFRVNANENRLKAKLKQCECKYEEVHLSKRTAPTKRYKSWDTPQACLDDMDQQTVASLKRGGAVKWKHFASLHGWQKNTAYGNVKEYAMDFIIMHCVYGQSADTFHAMKRVDIINHYQQQWKDKKPHNGQW